MNFINTMKTKLPHLFALIAGASLLLAANLHSQTPGGAGMSPPIGGLAAVAVDPSTGMPIPREPVRFSDATEKKRAEANFDDFPLTEVVTWLEKTFPDVNFVMPQRVRELNPAVVLRLRAVGLRDILEAINIATDGVVGYEVRSPTLVAFSSSQPAGVFGGGGEGFGAALPGQGLAGVAMEPPPTYQVMNLREVLRIKDPEAIQRTLDTIRQITLQTLEIMAADSPEPRPRQSIKSFEYHEGSGVLVIIGQPAAIKLAQDVIQGVRMQPSGGGGGSTGGVEPAEKKPAPKASAGDAK
jgi:hypothetical protein